jgi:thiol-disulfide isomerase/thioredoxin
MCKRHAGFSLRKIASPAALLFILPLAGLLIGCNKAPEPVAVAATPVKKEPVQPEETPILSEEDTALVKAGAPVSEADKVWRELQKSMQPPGYPPEWKDNEPTKEQVAEFEKKNGQLAGEAAEKVRQFYTKYPNDSHAAEARKREYDLLKVAGDLGNTNVAARAESLEEERLKDPSASPDERIAMRVQQIQRLMSAATETTITNALVKVEKAVRSLQTDFPDRADLASLTMSVADLWLDRGDLQKSRALAEEVLKAKGADQEIKDSAQALLSKVNRVGQPLDIKFSALDGREVDLQKLKGKVVLVDFWATWCGPCMRALPDVKATYEKLHGKGFEIVGISYDDNKEALQRTISSENMTWPQHFDEANAGKKFSEEFGVSTIPTMWLVDKKGILREINARTDLAGKVEKLLAEK